MTRFPNVRKFLPISSKSAKTVAKLQKTILKLGREDDSVKSILQTSGFVFE